jgi:predicted  nucleic acid-binding Zn-ribbon protein
MLKEIEKLCQIQDEDLKLIDIQKKITDLPKELKSLRDKVQFSVQEIDSRKSSLKQSQVERKKLELDLEGKLVNINKLDAKLMMIKTNQEYKALEKEIFGLKSDCSLIEDKILENMEQAEKLHKETEEKEKELLKAQDTLKQKEAEIKKQIHDLELERKQIAEKKQKIVADIDEPLYRKYTKIFMHNKDKVVVPVIDRTCGGCHMVLPPQVINDVFKEEHIIFCETCTRILYWTDTSKTDSAANEETANNGPASP